MTFACVVAWAVLLFVLTGNGERRDGSRHAPASAGARIGDRTNAAQRGGVRLAFITREQAAINAVQRSRYAGLLAGAGSAAATDTTRRPARGDRGAAGTTNHFKSWESARRHALNAIRRRVGDRAARAQLPVIAALRAIGARVVQRSTAPSAVIAYVPDDRLRAARAIAGVAAVAPAPRGRPFAISDTEGASVWHNAGCFGGGAADQGCPPAGGGATSATPGAPGAVNSADGHGGPDVALIDTGVNLFHSAWGARDPRVESPAHRQVAAGGADPCGGAPVVGGYWCGYGTQHGNAVAAIVGSRDGAHLGVAPGVDKLLDPLGANSVDDWLSGFASGSEAPAADLPEVVNDSLGSDSVTDDGYAERVADMFAATLGIARSAAAGNDGPIAQGADEKRVASPCIAYNTLCMGAVDTGGAGRADDTPSGYSNLGPSPSGRKKPDLLAAGDGECPSTADASSWIADCGVGTSYAAARGAGALALLAGAGVTNTAAQRALLINNSYMLPSQFDRFAGAARYWTPDGAWGELALDQTFANRGDYALGSVTAADGATNPPGANSARFFRIDGVQADERVTLAWNRGIQSPNWPDITGFAPRRLTDLDLYLYTTGGDTSVGVDDDDDQACSITGAIVSHCGVDAQEHSELLGDMHVPGDARDNVEQARAASAGSAIVKVKAASGIDGASAEPFALAGDHPITPLATPTLDISTPVLSDNAVHDGDPVTVTATITNQSSGADLTQGLTLMNVGATLVAPGVQNVTQTIGAPSTLAPGESATLRWTISASGDALHQISVNAGGTRFGETFGDASRPVTLAVDNVAPDASLTAPSSWLPSRTATLTWHATDALTGVRRVRVEASIDGRPYAAVYDGPNADGSVGVTAEEGQSVRARLRAYDAAGNASPYSEPPGWTVDADPPTIMIQAPAVVRYGEPATVIVRANNVGAPVNVYARTGKSQPFLPIEGDTLKLESVARLGLPVTVEAQAMDSLNRIVRAHATIRTRPDKDSLRIAGVKRGGKTLVAVTLPRKSDGTLVVSGVCGRRRPQTRVSLTGASGAVVDLRGGAGLCTVRAAFYPTASYQFAAAHASKRIRF